MVENFALPVNTLNTVKIAVQKLLVEHFAASLARKNIVGAKVGALTLKEKALFL